MSTSSILRILVFLGMSQTLFAQTQIDFITGANNRCTGVVACSSPDNRVKFVAVPGNRLDPKPPPPSTIIPRFKAFWLPGDGNYLEVPSTATDRESLNPEPYYYAKTGSYTVSVYLTGKYTNHNPPPGASRQINVGPVPTNGNTANTPTRFNEREGAGAFDFFAIHNLRKDYLTPLILSYPANIDSTWGYLFYNGHASGANWPERPLVYKKTPGEVANYYSGTAANIKAYRTTSLTENIEGTIFNGGFTTLKDRYSDVLYFPLEKTNAGQLPAGFTKKRYFPVFWADSSSSITLGQQDSLMSFCYIVTGTRPAAPTQQKAIAAMLNLLKMDLPGDSPINRFNDNSQAPPQYIQGIYMHTIPYVRAHDPNQLTVQKVVQQADGTYLVSFNLEMCNKGLANTLGQKIDLFDRFGNFHDFKFMNAAVPQMPANSGHYLMESTLSIAGVPELGYEMRCESIEFTAVTNCAGIRSLWAGNQQTAFEVCVRFIEAAEVECGENFPIDTCAFKFDEKCACLDSVQPVPTCGGTDWMLIFVLVFVFILLIWKYFFPQDNNM